MPCCHRSTLGQHHNKQKVCQAMQRNRKTHNKIMNVNAPSNCKNTNNRSLSIRT
eukprot:XP_001708070.1 Hypothetical protein GL50803_112704 [Giardia lamblia ATCC 50803]